MITLPNECYYAIFHNLQNDYKSLFSCALVNRQCCRIIIPILWSEPRHHFKNEKLIRVLFLTLNSEEQTLLIPFKINLPNHPKPLFEYTNYITSINYYFYDGIRNWLTYKKRELEKVVICSLIAMFLRTSNSLKYLYLDDEIFCNQLVFENLYENTTVTSIDLYHEYNINYGFKSKAIDALVKILCKNSTLTSLKLISILLGIKGMEILLEALYKNTVLRSLNLRFVVEVR
ncbi:f-box domain-containing protein [Gigaspora margarita]|uniref:F-box domain-containing protein n=1 Tax=Gigaspora margarita TaxID=4874 RepID=A0A8H4A284_GIGMA|nr:f-box domain-containing protein [Gigaspora margarita]